MTNIMKAGVNNMIHKLNLNMLLNSHKENYMGEVENASHQNKKWFRFSAQSPAGLILLSKLGSSTTEVLACLMACSSRVGACMIGQKVLANLLHISTRTVRRSIKKLSYYCLIAVMDVEQRNKVYVLNPWLVWRKSNKERINFGKTYDFPVNLVMSAHGKVFERIQNQLNIARANSIRSINFKKVMSERIDNKCRKFHRHDKRSYAKKGYDKTKQFNKLKKEKKLVQKLKKQLKNVKNKNGARQQVSLHH